MMQAYRGMGLTVSLDLSCGMPSAGLTQLAEVLENSKLAVRITFLGQDGSLLAILYPLSGALVASTGERYGG